MLQNRYSALKLQYVSDIKRLSFIVNGEVNIEHIPHNHTCPFCDGKLHAKKSKTYIDSAHSELNRIISQMNGLKETEDDLQSEQNQINKDLKEFQKKREQIELSIEKKLQPQAEILRKSLDGYRTYIQIQQELKVINTFALSWETYLRELPSEDETHIEYHPREYFDDKFLERIDKMLKEALTDCKHKNDRQIIILENIRHIPQIDFEKSSANVITFTVQENTES
jgi:hypothetical protein